MTVSRLGHITNGNYFVIRESNNLRKSNTIELIKVIHD